MLGTKEQPALEVLARIEELRAVKEGICTGFINEQGNIEHDGDTCPLHENNG